jgi:hypothetical protein
MLCRRPNDLFSASLTERHDQAAALSGSLDLMTMNRTHAGQYSRPSLSPSHREQRGFTSSIPISCFLFRAHTQRVQSRMKIVSPARQHFVADVL